jgi:hypothetical protein
MSRPLKYDLELEEEEYVLSLVSYDIIHNLSLLTNDREPCFLERAKYINSIYEKLGGTPFTFEKFEKLLDNSK